MSKKESPVGVLSRSWFRHTAHRSVPRRNGGVGLGRHVGNRVRVSMLRAFVESQTCRVVPPTEEPWSANSTRGARTFHQYSLLETTVRGHEFVTLPLK
jgi:hypothetical protein